MSDDEFEDSVEHIADEFTGFNEENPAMDKITELLELMITGQQRSAPNPRAFKPPEFDGKGDVEYFIRQFNDVAGANDWNDRSALLHLRTVLKDSAKDCGKSDDLDGAFTALRARFGTSPKEARSRLLTLKKDYKTGLQEHAADIEGLVELAFADLPAQNRREMALETFCSSLGNSYLQRHLLAVGARDIAAAVTAGNEFLQIRTGSTPGIRTITDDDEESSNQTSPLTKVDAVKVDPMEALLQAIKHLTLEVEQLKKPTQGRARRTEAPRQAGRCWGCNQEGHVRRKCPTYPWVEPAGNGRSPQQ